VYVYAHEHVYTRSHPPTNPPTHPATHTHTHTHTQTHTHPHEQVSEDAAEKAIKIESLNLKKPAEDVEAKLHEEKECADNDQDVG
jgi:hypothetical protein